MRSSGRPMLVERSRGPGRRWSVIGRGSSRGPWLAALLFALGCLVPRAASAQQWHELYADGVAALRDGRAERAVGLLRRAIEKRPQPGVRVPTYGTNFEPRYFPYLRLAEAYLLLGAAEKAGDVLKTSARFGVEPVEERTALEARVRVLLEAKGALSESAEAPAPTPTPVPPPTPTPAALPTPTAPPDLQPTPAAVPPPPVRPGASAPTPAPVARSTTSTRTVPPTAPPSAAGSRVTPPGERPLTPPSGASPRALDIRSDPPGARVFLDDEPVGRTDPETGRLRLRGLAGGRHRVRLSAEGREDFIREVDLAGEPVAIEGVLAPRTTSSPSAPGGAFSPPPAPAMLLPLVGGVVLLALPIGLWVWKMSRKPGAAERGEGAASWATPSTRGRRDPATDEIFPMAFGDYSLVRRIGKGGMAAVYEAVRGGESFALKRPLTGFLDDDRFRERFLREAELGRTLHHPNIIRIFDRGEVGNTPYFAMELLHGETLRARLDRDGRLDATLAARVTSRVAEALDYAHNKGVIHRDLKPSNIMLEGPEGVKVMDYGIARAQRLDGLTTTGAFLGTPSYAAPETVDAGAQPQSDVYSLGVVFFEMLTGSLPFRGDNAFALLRSHASTPPPAPSSLNYSLPETLDRLVLRLLSKELSERPTAEELLNELADFLRTGR